MQTEISTTDNRNMPGNSAANRRYIDQWKRSIKQAVKDFEKKDQRRILRAAAKPVVKASRGLAPVSDQPHYRYERRRGKFERAARAFVAKRKGSTRKRGAQRGGRKGVDLRKVAAVYYPGNLRKSLRTLVFRRSKDVFVGPRQGGKARKEYGRTVASSDGYYAQMVYGSAAAFQTRVLRPALVSSRSAALRKAREMREKIIERAKKRGVPVG